MAYVFEDTQPVVQKQRFIFEDETPKIPKQRFVFEDENPALDVKTDIPTADVDLQKMKGVSTLKPTGNRTFNFKDSFKTDDEALSTLNSLLPQKEEKAELPIKPIQDNSVLGFITRPFKSQAYKTAEMINKGVASFSSELGDIGDYLTEKIGFNIQRDNKFKDAANFYLENADYWNRKAQEVGANKADEIIGEAVGGAVPGISQFMFNVYGGSFLQGAAEAKKTGKSELWGGLSEQAKTTLIKKSLDTTAYLKLPYKVPATAGIFAAQTAGQGGTPEEIAKSAGVGALYGTIAPGKIGAKELKQAVKEAPEFITEIAKSDWYRGLSNRERALVPVAIEKLKATGEFNAERARTNPDYFQQLLKERMTTETTIPEPPSVKSPAELTVEAEQAKLREAQAKGLDREQQLKGTQINAIDTGQGADLLLKDKSVKIHIQEGVKAGLEPKVTENNLRELLNTQYAKGEITKEQYLDATRQLQEDVSAGKVVTKELKQEADYDFAALDEVAAPPPAAETVKSSIGKTVGFDAETGLPIIDRTQKAAEQPARPPITPQEVPSEPKDINAWVLRKGGINYEGEHWKGELRDLRDALNQGKRMGYGNKVIKSKGAYTLDELALMAKDEGYISEATPQSLLDAMLQRKKSITQAEELPEPSMPKAEIDIAALKEGDKVFIDGEEYQHKGVDENGNVILKDGLDYSLDAFDRFKVDATEEGKPIIETGTKYKIGDTVQIYDPYREGQIGKITKILKGERITPFSEAETTKTYYQIDGKGQYAENVIQKPKTFLKPQEVK